MKSYTDLEQSKKLEEFLPIESADMHYSTWTILDGEFIVSPNQGDTIEDLREDYGSQIIPCWSLAALLNIFPCSKESPIVNLTRGGWNPSFTRRWFATWEDEDKNVFYSCNGISPVDAVVELILKLHEQKTFVIVNYEQKHKEALERAKRLHSEPTGGTERIVCEQIFPELKESDGEWIKDDIKDVIQAAIIPEESKREMLAWLEKQGEKLDADKVIDWLRFHIQVDEPKIEYNEDGQPLAESFIAHAKARCVAADEVVKKFKKDFVL